MAEFDRKFKAIEKKEKNDYIIIIVISIMIILIIASLLFIFFYFNNQFEDGEIELYSKIPELDENGNIKLSDRKNYMGVINNNTNIILDNTYSQGIQHVIGVNKSFDEISNDVILCTTCMGGGNSCEEDCTDESSPPFVVNQLDGSQRHILKEGYSYNITFNENNTYLLTSTPIIPDIENEYNE